MTLSIVYYDELGCVTRHTTGMPPNNSEMWLENTEPEVDPLSCYVKNGKLLPMGSPPSINHVFDYATKQWIDPRSLQDFKDAQWEQVKLQRSDTEFSVFKFQGVYYDCDRVSQSRIQGAVQLASIALANNQTVVQEWTTADNSVVSLNATDLLNLGLQLGLFINKVHDYGRVLRARIAAADSSLDVQEVLWDEAEFNATLQ